MRIGVVRIACLRPCAHYGSGMYDVSDIAMRLPLNTSSFFKHMSPCKFLHGMYLSVIMYQQWTMLWSPRLVADTLPYCQCMLLFTGVHLAGPLHAQHLMKIMR